MARFPGGNSGQDAKVPVQPHNIDPGKNRGKSDIQTESTGSSIEEEEDNNGGQEENLRESGEKKKQNYMMELSNVHTKLMSLIARAWRAI